ncbi:MAG: MarR family winged helix-turn-helix transcriptional regulator [Porticoccaceae bacterium]
MFVVFRVFSRDLKMVNYKHRTESALRAIRSLIRAAELEGKRLAAATGLTPSQLVVLQEVARHEKTTAGAIATAVRFGHATVTNIVDRLEQNGLVVRRRGEQDRRQVWVTVTANGRSALSAAPDMLQDTFQTRYEALPDWEQAMIAAMLERLTALLDADTNDAAPLIDAGKIDRPAPGQP